jgi:hypothetical protein
MLELMALVCIGLAWLVPNHYQPWLSFYNESCSALGLLLLVLALGRRWGAMRTPVVAWVVMAVALVPWLQWAFGLLAFSGDAWVSSLYVAGFGVAIATGFIWACNDLPRAAVRLACTTLVAATVSAALALYQGFGLSGLGIWALDAVPGMRAYANLAQPNNLGTLLGLGALGLLLLRERGRIGGVAGAAVLGLLLVGAALTQSRTALLFGPVIALGLYFARRRGVGFRTGPGVALLASLCHGLLTWYWPTAQKALLLGATGSLEARGVESLRFQVWPILFDALSQVPWTGFGWLQVGAAQLATADRHPPVGELWLHGHNLFIELLVWCGYPLGLGLGVLVLYWFVSRALRVATVEGVVGMLMVAVFGVHAMLELPYHYAYFLIPLGLWIGIVEASVGSRGALAAKWALLPAALCVALTAGIWRDYPALEADFQLVRFENLRIGDVHATQPAPDAPLMSELAAYLRFSRRESAAGMSAAELATMDAEVKRRPYAGSMVRYAVALALNGRLDAARQLLVKLRHIHGELVYVKVRRDLSERIAQGQAGLRPLLESLPD